MEPSELRVSTTELIGPQLQRLQSGALLAAAAGLVLCGISLVQGLPQLFTSYLFAYLFWIGASLGSLGLLMLHHTVGGGWGFVLRRFLEAASSPLLLAVLGVLFIPVVAPLFTGIPALYAAPGGWAHAETFDHLARAKQQWFTSPLLGTFLGRSVLYFLIWIGFSWLIRSRAKVLEERSDQQAFNSLNRIGGFGILMMVLTVTFASVDWVMALTPDWFSSIFGLLAAASMALTALALMLVLAPVLAGDRPIMRSDTASRFFRDLGNLMLALVLLWAYMAFSQYLITYSGNTAEEVSWYIRRQSGGWMAIGVLLMVAHFGLPFLVLLIGSRVKRDPKRLGEVAAFILLMRFVDLFWLVAPTFRPQISVTIADFGAPLLIGGIWLWLWAREVRDRPLVPLHDPRLEEHLHGVVAHG